MVCDDYQYITICYVHVDIVYCIMIDVLKHLLNVFLMSFI